MAKTKPSFFIRFMGAVLMAGAVACVQPWLVWNLTDSVDAKLMLRTQSPAQKGDYVLFSLTHPYLNGGRQAYRLTKRWRCGAGDRLLTRGAAFYCNGERVALALERTASGKPLVPFQWNGPIPAGQAFVLGEDPQSFDSRYWGFVSVDQLERLVAIL